MNIATLLRHAAQAHADRPAVRYGGRQISYRELEARAASFASALRKRGLRPGDRVALFAHNCPEYVITMFGAWWAGMVIVPINAKLIAAEVATSCEIATRPPW